MMTPRHDHAAYTGKYWWYVASCAGAVLVFVGTALVARQGVAPGEGMLFHLLNDLPPIFYRAMLVLAFLGSLWMAAISVVGAFVARLYRLAWRLALSICLAYGCAMLSRLVVDRAYPAQLLSDVHVRASEIGVGFPSLYVMIVTVLACSLVPYVDWRWRWTAPIAIGVVAVSRLYLGAALPLDIIGGFALGVAVVAVLRILPQPLRILLRID